MTWWNGVLYTSGMIHFIHTFTHTPNTHAGLAEKQLNWFSSPAYVARFFFFFLKRIWKRNCFGFSFSLKPKVGRGDEKVPEGWSVRWILHIMIKIYSLSQQWKMPVIVVGDQNEQNIRKLKGMTFMGWSHWKAQLLEMWDVSDSGEAAMEEKRDR